MSIERLDKIIHKYNALETLANKHKGTLYETFLSKSGDLKNESSIRKEYDQQIDANRDLQIGIVGRVKAGKSSLLNALLFGGSTILPKAATPMTAALTVLSYSEKLKVTIKFFEKNDFEELRKGSEAYENKLHKLTEEFVEKARKKNELLPGLTKTAFDENKARERGKRESQKALREDIGLSGASEQYKQIKSSSISQQSVEGKIIELYPKSVAEISTMLADYVGSNGKYMPFTQSVEIAYPNEKLKGIRIVDTPGFNDPVPSREKRAFQLLKASDVVLILSSAGRFLDASDKEVLDKITTKDGLRELFIIASQVDTQLLGDEYADMTLDEVQNDIARRLSRQARSVLSACNEHGTFDQLINDDGSRVILTSGDCQSMFLTFANKNTWDDNKKRIWENLCDCFRDYFSDKDDATSKESLKHLGNIDSVESKIDEVKQKKKEILDNSANKICTSWENAIDDIKKEMEKAVKQKIGQIKDSDVSSLQNERNSIESFCFKVEAGISNAINNTVDIWRSETTERMTSFVDALQNNARNNAKDAKTNFSRREYSHTTGMWWWKEDHYNNVDHTRVNPYQLRSSIEDYLGKLTNTLKSVFLDQKYQLGKNISSNIASIWAKKAPDKEMDEDDIAVKIKAIINELNIVGFNRDRTTLPTELHVSGYQEDEKGEHLLAVCRSYLNRLANETNTWLIDEIARYAASIKKADLASKFLERYRKELDEKIRNIQNKEQSINSYNQILKELESIT